MAEPFAEHQHRCPTHGLWTCTCKWGASSNEKRGGVPDTLICRACYDAEMHQIAERKAVRRDA